MIVALLIPPAIAEEVESRFRISLTLGGHDTLDAVRSASANVLTLIDDDGNRVDRFIDPRNDAAVEGELAIEPGSIATLALQYAPTRTLVLEAALGRHATDVGQLEVHLLGRPFVRLEAGRLRRMPVELSALVRFRPESTFNPYFGAGMGYSFVGFEPSAAFDTLALNLHASAGVQAELRTEQNGAGLTLPNPIQPVQLGPATVDAPDSFQWQVVAGAELGFARRWAVVFDLRYAVFSHGMRIRFDGRDELGISVPQGTAPQGSPAAEAIYGPTWVATGGLLDTDGDGVPETGAYWVQGGKLAYDGIAAQIGIRRTF